MKSIIAVFCFTALWGCASKSAAPVTVAPPVLPVLTLTAASISTYQQYPASIEGVSNVEIRPQVSGILEQLMVDEGAYVNAGQPIFKIDEQPFRASLNNAVASLHAAEGALQNANIEVDKLTPLVENKVIADYQLKTARATAAIAIANIDQAKATITNAQINLGYTTIKSPVSGYIGRLVKKKGSLVGPSDADALTQVSDVHIVRVYFSLAEKDFVLFKQRYPGETLADKLRQLPGVSLYLSDNSVYPLEGKVDMIDGQFDKNTGAITLRANFANPQGLLRSGNTGKIQLALLHENALSVPQTATIEMQDKVFVFALVDSNKVKKQSIEIAGKNGDNYLVTGGLKAGDKVVADGIGILQEGTVIQPDTTAPKITVVKK